jgi:hypothetical protein
MSYKKIDFNECLFNPLEDGDMMLVYPKLRELSNPILDNDSLLDKLIRYVIIVYDNKSPVNRKERDWLKRKTVAAEICKLHKIDIALLQDIYLNKNETVLHLTSKYLFNFIKIKEYSALVAFEYKYNENITELLTPIKGETNAERLDAAKKKSVISLEIINDINVIDKLWDEIFIEKDLIKEVKIRKISPENINV